jgi:prepilin-type N-terminal cleavage/methylation domain-containing protein
MRQHDFYLTARQPTGGFTLIELSIVLVIIGLIVGGVLVGQDLIQASYVRAQITQIERFNSAVNTFYGKYGMLPGDMNMSVAQQYGFSTRGSGPGLGDGNGIIEGVDVLGSQASGETQNGETGLFWVDLTSANGLNLNLVEGSYYLNAPAPTQYGGMLTSFPVSKLGQGNVDVVWSVGGINYYSILQIGYMHPAWDGMLIESNYPNPGLCGTNLGPKVIQAYKIDLKLDDGFPTSGNVLAMSPNDFYVDWAGYSCNTAVPASASASNASCFDNAGGTGIMQYSIKQNKGAGANCPLSFKFQ